MVAAGVISGVELWRGASLLDGGPIVAVATGIGTLASTNTKTGPMVQVWFLARGLSPIAASERGTDRSVCGDCDFRRHLGGACYVHLTRGGPFGVWVRWARGEYPPFPPFEGWSCGRGARLGAYGDPVAAPLDALGPLLGAVPWWTGYTHQWQRPEVRASGWREVCMASTSTRAERTEAWDLGWRTFRAALPWEPPERGEVWCPAALRPGAVRCVDCRICDGAKPGRPRRDGRGASSGPTGGRSSWTRWGT